MCVCGGVSFFWVSVFFSFAHLGMLGKKQNSNRCKKLRVVDMWGFKKWDIAFCTGHLNFFTAMSERANGNLAVQYQVLEV